METREAAVAGSFYPRDKKLLEKTLCGFFKGKREEKKSDCIVSPHAGYIYSGGIAALAFSSLQEADCFIVMSPNHTGLGEPISVSSADEWETPLGKIPVAAAEREKLLGALGIEADDLAHIQEHSIEVQLPFLQHCFSGFEILPITIGTQRLQDLLALGNAVSELKGKISVVASSDFSHFVPLETAEKNDLAAIKKITALDVEGFHGMVAREHLSICGSAPIAAAIQYCRKTGHKSGRLLGYGTSASATGDKNSVVGYAAIKFEKHASGKTV